MTTYIYKDELCHHGIKGQKWGVRRFQNPDGTLTAEGKTRYSDDEKRERRKQIAKKVAIGSALVGGAILVAYGAKKLNERKIDPSSTNNLLKDLGIATFEPESFKYDTFEPEGSDMFKRLKTQTDTFHKYRELRSEATRKILEEQRKPKEKSLSDFTFERRLMLKKDGSTNYQDVPVDKIGYAEAFAKAMSKGSKKETEDYKYWYDYIVEKIK